MNIVNVALIIVILIFLFLGLLAFGFFLYALLPIFFWGGIYVPSTDKAQKSIIALANVKPGEKVVDLGSGDGRLTIAFAKAGAQAHGYEINPVLVLMAKRNIRKTGLSGKAFIHWKNFWQEDFSDFDIITIYGISYIMQKLEKKLKKELKAQARVICVSFPFPNWPCSKKENNVYLYEA